MRFTNSLSLSLSHAHAPLQVTQLTYCLVAHLRHAWNSDTPVSSCLAVWGLKRRGTRRFSLTL